METYELERHIFILIHLPQEVLKYSLTAAAKFGTDYAWSILKTGVQDMPYRGINGVLDPRISKWVFGDKYFNTLALLEPSVATQYDEITEWELYTPLFDLKNTIINNLEIYTIPGYPDTSEDATVFFSMTKNGVSYSREYTRLYGNTSEYDKRFILRRLGYIRHLAGLKFRGASRSRMAFNKLRINE